MKTKIAYYFLVWVGVVFFIASLFSPFLSVREFYFFSETITIFSALIVLMDSQEWLLFMVILVFVIILPSIKYALLFIHGLNKTRQANTSMMVLEAISKWAMLDVFIVAIIIASIKLKFLASAQTHYGLYLFVASVLISIACVHCKNVLLEAQK